MPLPWLPMEQRWRDCLLAAVLPPDPATGRAGIGDLDLREFWEQLQRVAPPLIQLGLRAAVWVLTWSPVFLLGRLRSFGGLSPEERDTLLVRAAGSRWYLLRQLADLLKLMACFAYFRHQSIREKLGVPGGSAP
ncbi:MAG: hypothetical protein JRI25_03980 [Deltaproteobacteria bacterium]|nr:hypothetical protein [Deltaproteobacteria bacterium]MBW2253738.1 hypothetical protein [Deltaproteobacteria bacterium]